MLKVLFGDDLLRFNDLKNFINLPPGINRQFSKKILKVVPVSNYCSNFHHFLSI